MKHLLLERKPTTHTETEGFLSFGKTILATVERPWIEADTPGGKPYESCVPDGLYRLRPHTRPDPDPTDDKPGQSVVALINPDLGVYYLEADMPAEGGRFLVLIHLGNWAHDVVGCIAPGLAKGASSRGPMVKSSRAAMGKLMSYLNGEEAELEIRWIV